MGRWLRMAALVALLAGLAGLSRAALDRRAADTAADLLYLPNGKHLKMMSLGNAPLMADAMFLWAIQYYSNYDNVDRRRYVEHVFSSVITELDPHYIDAYWLGAVILTVETRDLEAGLRLLDKGAENNPDRWILPYLAAWECYHAREYARSAEYFDRAAAIPGAPAVVRRMRAGMRFKAGDLEDAIRLWSDLLEDPNTDPLSVKIATRKIRELQVRSDIQQLQLAVQRFREQNRRNPRRLEELVAGGYVDALPRDPDGAAYLYDSRNGSVSSPAGRVLGDS